MKIKIKNLQKKVPIPQSTIHKVLKAAQRSTCLTTCDEGPRCSHLKNLSVVFVGHKRMRAANQKYLTHDYATDVLSFDLGDGFGEIMVCPQVARAQATQYKTSTKREIILYTIHGFLHLCGFDDHTKKDTERMRAMEDKILNMNFS